MKLEAIVKRYPEIKKSETHRLLIERYDRVKEGLSLSEKQVKKAKRQYRMLQSEKSVSSKKRKAEKEAYKKAKKIRDRYRYLMVDTRLLLKRWFKVYADEQRLRKEGWLIEPPAKNSKARSDKKAGTTAKTKKSGEAKQAAKPAAAKENRRPGPKPPPKRRSTEKASSGDDLKRINGIGPKIERFLQTAGIDTFERLSNANAASLRDLLDAGGRGLRRINPDSWPAQAKLAAQGKWEALADLQESMKKG